MNTNLFRALVLTFLACIAATQVALANRNVYTKEQVDTKVESIQRELDYMHRDIEWLVRNQGGVPSAETREDHSPSQPDAGR
jgi:hypothetical protein